MSHRIAKRQDFLKLLAKTKQKDSKRRNALIDIANKYEMDAISELILNALKGNIRLSPKLQKQMQKEKINWRKIAEKKCPVNRKKKILKQRGGILASILPIALKAAAAILGPLFTS